MRPFTEPSTRPADTAPVSAVCQRLWAERCSRIRWSSLSLVGFLARVRGLPTLPAPIEQEGTSVAPVLRPPGTKGLD